MARKKKNLYCKEKNLLQLPLFCFEKKERNRFVVEWKENGRKSKILCSSPRKLPGSFEMDVYSAVMRLWVLQGMPVDGVEVENTLIAKTLGLNYENWHTKIKESILNLGAARYEFTECFVDAKKRKNVNIQQFSLFNGTSVNEVKDGSKKLNKYKLTFPEELKINLEVRYYQWLDFDMYLSIKSGVARRLYEFLEKRRYHSKADKFNIAEDKVYRWIPITSSNIQQRRRTLKKALKYLVDAGYLLKGSHGKGNWCFEYAKKIKNKRKSKQAASSVGAIEKKNGQLTELFEEARQISESMKKFLEKCYSENGFDYVLWNIRYANTMAKKSYLTYLRRSLKENWAVDWKENQIEKAVKTDLIDKEEAKKYKEDMEKKMLLDQQREMFEKEHNKLTHEEKRALWVKADCEIDKKQIGRGLLVAIEYRKLVETELENRGIAFDKDAVSSIDFTRKIMFKP